MAVVATRMHDAFVFRRIRSARELGYGQGVNVASQRDATARISLCVIRIGRRSFDGRDNTVSRYAVYSMPIEARRSKGICRLGLFQR